MDLTKSQTIAGAKTFSDNVTATSFTGSGAGLTGVTASGLTAGTYGNTYNFTNPSNTFTGNGVVVTASGSGTGVRGSSTSGVGMYGVSTSGDGVYGFSSGGYGVHGQQGHYEGFLGFSDGGVFGRNNTSGYYGYLGLSNYAGYFNGPVKISGTLSSGSAASFNNGSGVAAVSGNNTSDGPGVYGISTSGYGVHGFSAGGYAGVVGMYGQGGTAATGSGVYGSSNSYSGNGVYGVVSNGTNNAGVYGTSSASNGNGVIGEANNGPNARGVLGISSSGYAGWFQGKVNVTDKLTAGPAHSGTPLAYATVNGDGTMNGYNMTCSWHTSDATYPSATICSISGEYFDTINYVATVTPLGKCILTGLGWVCGTAWGNYYAQSGFIVVTVFNQNGGVPQAGFSIVVYKMTQ